MPVVGGALVIAGGVVAPRWGAESILGLRPVQWLGKRSYSLYLWHWPILILAAERVGKSQLTAPENVPYLIVAVLLSMASYRFLENPIRHIRSPSRSTVVVGAALVLVTVVVLTCSSAPKPPSREHPASPQRRPRRSFFTRSAIAPRITTIPDDLLPSLATTQQDFAGLNRHPKLECALADSGTQIEKHICTLGDPTGKSLLVVYGDSHTLMWLPAFNQIARQAHWRLVVLTSYFCPAELVTVSNPSSLGAPGSPNILCDQFHSWAMAHINAMHPTMVVISQSSLYETPGSAASSGGLFTKAAWGDGLANLLHALQVAPDQKIFLGNIPELPSDPPTCLSAHVDDIQACSAPVSGTANGFATTERNAVAMAGGRFIDPTPWFCSDMIIGSRRSLRCLPRTNST